MDDSYIHGRRDSGHENHQWYDGDIITNLLGKTADGANSARIYMDENVTDYKLTLYKIMVESSFQLVHKLLEIGSYIIRILIPVDMRAVYLRM